MQSHPTAKHSLFVLLATHIVPCSLNNLANALQTRFEQLGRMDDLEDAITSYRKALTLRPPGHPARSSSLNNLAMLFNSL
jgi:hypothetical protein